MDRLGNNFHSLSLINTRRHALALSGLASAGRKLQQSPLRPAERLLICSKAGSNCHFGTRFQCEKPPRMHHSKNETSLNLLPAHIYTMQVTVDSKRRLEPADLIQASGKAGIAQAFATAFDPVPVRAPPPRQGCSLVSRKEKARRSLGTIDRTGS